MVAGRFAGRIGAVGLVTVLLGKGRLVHSQGAIDLVGRDVQKPEVLTLMPLESAPIMAHRLEQAKCTHDVGLDKGLRTQNRTVDMGLGRKIDHGPRSVLDQQTRNQRLIADVAMHKQMARIVLHSR